MKQPNTVKVRVAPMLEHYVKKYSRDDSECIKQHRLNREDCCAYCDAHGADQLPPRKHKQIQAWTEQVNDNMSNNTTSHLREKKATRKVEFVKYTPLGIPDVDEGFRRIRTPTYLKQYKINTTKSQNKPRAMKERDSEQHVLKSSSFPMSTPHKHNTIDRISSSAQSKHRDKTNNNEDRHINGASSDPVIVEDTSQTESTESSPRSAQLGVPSNSNRLLNVVSIDDCFQQHRAILALTSPWMGARTIEILSNAEKESTKPKLDVSELSTGSHLRNHFTPEDGLSKLQTLSAVHNLTSTGQPENGLDLNLEDTEKSTKENEKLGKNEAVKTGFKNLEELNEATSTFAHKGLYKFDKSCGQPFPATKESKRFQKMNKQLHKMLEEFHVNGTALSLKMKQRRWMEDNESNQTHSRPPSASTYSSFAHQKVRFKSNRRTDTIPEDTSGGEDGRESFLQMVMDLDQKKQNGDVQLQAYLYL